MNLKLVFFFLSLYSTGLFGQKAFYLADAIEYALKNNYDVNKARLEKMISYERTQEVITQGFPKISGSIGYQNQFIVPTSLIPGETFGQPGKLLPVQFGVANSMSATVGLQQLIFDGRYLVGLQARQAIKDLSNTQVSMSQRDVKVLISKSYFQAVMAASSLKSLRESKLVLDKLYDQSQKTYKQGLIEELDVERLQYNVKSLQNTIEMLESQSELANLALKYNMGFPMNDTMILLESVDRKIDTILNQKYLDENLSNRIELKMVDQALKLKEYDIKQLKYSALPSFFGSAAFGYNSFSRSFNFWNNPWYSLGNFGIQANIPIFDGFTRKSQITQANLGLQKLQTEKLQIQSAIQMEHTNARLSMLNTIHEYQNQKDIMRLSEKIERKTQIKYKEGIGSSFEFANAQNDRIQQYLKLLQTELKLLNLDIDFQKSSGKLF